MFKRRGGFLNKVKKTAELVYWGNPKRHNSSRKPREELGLQFPALSARQKQFALNPAHPEYYRERPDFLQFGLQALDDSSDPRQEAAKESEKEALILEKQLEAVLEGLHHGDAVGDTKRAMVGEPRALP